MSAQIRPGDEIGTGGPMAWGLHTVLDLYGCDLATMTDTEAIRQFSAMLVALLDMQAYGDPVVQDFGYGDWKPGDPEEEKPATAGYTLVQLIETSLISAHFADKTRTVYLDVFSCKPYDPQDAARLAQRFFGAQTYAMKILNRGSVTSPRSAPS